MGDSELLLSIPDCQVWNLAGKAKLLVERGTVQVIMSKIDRQDITFVVLNSFTVALRKATPCMRAAPLNYVFVAKGGPHGLVLPSTTPADTILMFEAILEDESVLQTPRVALPAAANGRVAVAAAPVSLTSPSSSSSRPPVPTTPSSPAVAPPPSYQSVMAASAASAPPPSYAATMAARGGLVPVTSPTASSSSMSPPTPTYVTSPTAPPAGYVVMSPTSVPPQPQQQQQFVQVGGQIVSGPNVVVVGAPPPSNNIGNHDMEVAVAVGNMLGRALKKGAIIGAKLAARGAKAGYAYARTKIDTEAIKMRLAAAAKDAASAALVAVGEAVDVAAAVVMEKAAQALVEELTQ